MTNSDIMSNDSSKCSNAMKIHKCKLKKVKKDRQSICPEFTILGHSLWSHAANMIYSHFSESLFMTKAPLETCTSLDIAGVCLWKSFLYQSAPESLPFGLSTNLMKA